MNYYMGWVPNMKKEIKQMKDRYEEKGFTGLEYSDMDTLFDLEARIIELESRIKIYEQSLKQIAESDTLEFAKRTARITLG